MILIMCMKVNCRYHYVNAKSISFARSLYPHPYRHCSKFIVKFKLAQKSTDKGYTSPYLLIGSNSILCLISMVGSTAE